MKRLSKKSEKVIREMVEGGRLTLKGEVPENIPWIEHVLPVTSTKYWRRIFTKEQHEEMKDLLANLIPLSSDMNKSISNKPYTAKRQRYLNDAMFKSARDFARKYHDWTPKLLEKRSQELALWAVARWPY